MAQRESAAKISRPAGRPGYVCRLPSFVRGVHRGRPAFYGGEVMDRPRLLDLFCGAGGCSMGYHRAGFDVTGVDINPQPRYPFTFIQADVMTLDPEFIRSFDAVHASPPCQKYSRTASLHGNNHPDLYEAVRDMLNITGAPWIIENVVGSPYETGIILCGSMFGLGVWRHRHFEASFILLSLACRHDLVPEPIDVTGTGGPCDRLNKSTGGAHRKPKNLAHAQEVMGINWMTRKELSQAIPPAYTNFIGKQLMEYINAKAK